jgi:peptidoglycan/LPS O-acetylase OafA/YrhL
MARDTNGMLPVAWAVFAGLVGPAVAAFCLAVEPPPANPNAPEPLIATLLGFALMVAWGGAAITASRRRASALTWASVVGGLSMAMTISCPLSGHHTSTGMWWISQFIVCSAAWAVAGVGKHSMARERAET